MAAASLTPLECLGEKFTASNDKRASLPFPSFASQALRADVVPVESTDGGGGGDGGSGPSDGGGGGGGGAEERQWAFLRGGTDEEEDASMEDEEESEEDAAYDQSGFHDDSMPLQEFRRSTWLLHERCQLSPKRAA